MASVLFVETKTVQPNHITSQRRTHTYTHTFYHTHKRTHTNSIHITYILYPDTLPNKNTPSYIHTAYSHTLTHIITLVLTSGGLTEERTRVPHSTRSEMHTLKVRRRKNIFISIHTLCPRSSYSFYVL